MMNKHQLAQLRLQRIPVNEGVKPRISTQRPRAPRLDETASHQFKPSTVTSVINGSREVKYVTPQLHAFQRARAERIEFLEQLEHAVNLLVMRNKLTLTQRSQVEYFLREMRMPQLRNSRWYQLIDEVMGVLG